MPMGGSIYLPICIINEEVGATAIVLFAVSICFFIFSEVLLKKPK